MTSPRVIAQTIKADNRHIVRVKGGRLPVFTYILYYLIHSLFLQYKKYAAFFGSKVHKRRRGRIFW